MGLYNMELELSLNIGSAEQLFGSWNFREFKQKIFTRKSLFSDLCRVGSSLGLVSLDDDDNEGC